MTGVVPMEQHKANLALVYYGIKVYTVTSQNSYFLGGERWGRKGKGRTGLVDRGHLPLMPVLKRLCWAGGFKRTIMAHN